MLGQVGEGLVDGERLVDPGERVIEARRLELLPARLLPGTRREDGRYRAAG